MDPQDPAPPVEEDQREIIPASKRVAGTHEIEIDLRNTHGVYSFFLCTEPPETFGYFAAPFIFKLENGVVTIESPVNDNPPYSGVVTEGEPIAEAPKLSPKCVSCAGGQSRGYCSRVPSSAIPCSRVISTH